MEQKAKKRLNVIDIIAIVVILAAVLFVGYKMMDRGGETVQPEMWAARLSMWKRNPTMFWVPMASGFWTRLIPL